MGDVDYGIQMGLASDPLRASVLRSAVAALAPPPGSRGLDAGCGVGQPALLLARAVGSKGHLVGLERSPDLLANAAASAGRARLLERISFVVGDIRRLPFADSSLDWAWSADC